jgi:hypothetical protein
MEPTDIFQLSNVTIVRFEIPYIKTKIPEQIITVRGRREESKYFNPSRREESRVI